MSHLYFYPYKISTVEAKEMRRSAELAEMHANLANEANKEPGANNDRLKDKISKIATLDNGTMVEAFKYLNYRQLAKNSLVTKRYRNLIGTHRHSLALLYVEYIGMYSHPFASAAIEVFDKELTPEAYNEWVIRNKYSKQAPLQDQVADTESTQNVPKRYQLFAYAHYNDQNHCELLDKTRVLSACAEVNDDNWPVFQHFVRLLTDPFIYINWAQLAYQTDVLNLLAKVIDSDRLQCKELFFDLNGKSQKSITWTKDHVRSNQFFIYGEADLNHDEAFLDFLLTGAHCTPSIKISYLDLSKVVVDFVQKFMDLKNADGSHIIEAVEGNIKGQIVKLLNRDYAEFIVKEERGRWDNTHIFEFVNDNIGKKLQLTAENYRLSNFWIKINNL